jgi:ATP adenylyltransferase
MSAMDVLWAPWRMRYILDPKPDTCVFCLDSDTAHDRDRLVLARGAHCFLIMNRYPYNSGHVMVCPYRHASCLTELTMDEANEMMQAMRTVTAVLGQALRPHGLNIGLNLGEAAGAGIASHMHFQIVPRWNGDNSFMAVFGQTHVIPELLLETYDRLKPLVANQAPFSNP